MKNFDKAFSKIKADLVFEAASKFLEVKDANAKFDFRKDDNGNSVCVFKITRNQEEITVTAFCNKKKVDKFIIQKQDGSSEEMSEKAFAGDYWKDYDEFKDALKKYDDLKKSDESYPNKTAKINAFSGVLNPDDPSKIIKTYEIDGKTFMFKKIEDISVESYYEVLFDTVDKETDEVIYNKALAYVRKGQSLVFKIVEFNGKGERLNTITFNDLEMKEANTAKQLTKAVEKMANYIDIVVKPEI